MSRLLLTCCATLCLAVVCTAAACGGAGGSDGFAATASSPSHTATPSPDPAAGVLRAEKQALMEALVAQMKHDVLREERARERFGRPDSWTAVDEIEWDHPGLRRLVHGYFDALVRGGLPGPQGAVARRDLARYFAPGAAELERARWFAAGRVPKSDRALPEDFTLATLAAIHSIRLSHGARRATVVVDPIRAFWVYTLDEEVVKGSVDQLDEDWDYLAVDAPHRLTLVRRGGGWTVADDFTLGWSARDVALRLRRGGASRDVCRAEAARIRAAVKRPARVPAGAVAAFRRFIDLLNAHQYAATDALFEDGRGYRAFMFSDPWGDGRYVLRGVRGFAPLSAAAVASAPDVPVVLDIDGDGAGYSYAGGGMLGYSTWHAHRTESGEWLIAGDGTDIPWPLAGRWP